MPFINGRYYMNPHYGVAIERARQADETNDSDVQLEDSSAPHFVNMSTASQRQASHNPAPQTQFSTNDMAHQSDSTPSQAQEHKAEVGYGETAGLIPEKSPRASPKAAPYDRRAWDQDSAHELEHARTHIMDISSRNPLVHRAKPGKDTVSQAVWGDNMRAATKSTGSLPGNHFFIRQEGIGLQRPPERMGWGHGKPIRTYGPFRNVGGGDVPKGDHTYIDIYNR